MPYDWELQYDGTLDVFDPDCNDVVDAHDVGLCAGPFQVQEPISSECPQFEYDSDRTIENSFNPAPDVGSSDPGQLPYLDVNFGSNSILDHSSQNPSSFFADQLHTTENIPLANNIDPLPMPGGPTDFDRHALPLPSFPPSATFGGLLSDVPSLGSIPTQPTSPSLMSQADIQHSSRLPLPPRGKSSYICSVCGSAFALRAQLRYISPSEILPLLMLICHLRRHAKDHKTSACNFKGCNKTFTEPKDLRRHQSTVHADQSSTPLPLRACDQCNYTTRRPDHLKRHKDTHQKNLKGRKRKR